jgi:hypothetical protein
MKGYSDIQAEVGAATKTKYTTYAESHPKSYQCFNCTRNGKRADIKRDKTIFTA